MTSLSPSMRATPSPVSRTTPTLLFAVDVFSPSIFVSISSSMLLMTSYFRFCRGSCRLPLQTCVQWLELLLQAFEPIAYGSVPHVAAYANAHSAKQLRVNDELARQVAAVLVFQIGNDFRFHPRIYFSCGLNARTAFLQFKPKKPAVIFQDINIVTRFSGDQCVYERADSAGVELAIGETGAQ